MCVCDSDVWIYGSCRTNDHGWLLQEADKRDGNYGKNTEKGSEEIRKRYEDISLLDVDVRDTAAFVDKYIDRLKIGLISVNAWNAFIKNLGVIAAGTGIFAAVYQYHVVGDGERQSNC